FGPGNDFESFVISRNRSRAPIMRPPSDGGSLREPPRMPPCARPLRGRAPMGVGRISCDLPLAAELVDERAADALVLRPAAEPAPLARPGQVDGDRAADDGAVATGERHDAV